VKQKNNSKSVIITALLMLVIFMCFDISASVISLGYVTGKGNTKEAATANFITEAITQGLKNTYKIVKEDALYHYIINKDTKYLKELIASQSFNPYIDVGDSYIVTNSIDLDKNALDAEIKRYIRKKFKSSPRIAVSFVVTSSLLNGTSVFELIGGNKTISKKKTEHADMVNTIIEELVNEYRIKTKTLPINLKEELNRLNQKADNTYSARGEERNLLAISKKQNIDLLVTGVINVTDVKIGSRTTIAAGVNGAIYKISDKDQPEDKQSFHEEIEIGSSDLGKALHDIYFWSAKRIFFAKILSKLAKKEVLPAFNITLCGFDIDMQIEFENILDHLGDYDTLNDEEETVRYSLTTSMTDSLPKLKKVIYKKMTKKMQKKYKKSIKIKDRMILIGKCR